MKSIYNWLVVADNYCNDNYCKAIDFHGIDNFMATYFGKIRSLHNVSIPRTYVHGDIFSRLSCSANIAKINHFRKCVGLQYLLTNRLLDGALVICLIFLSFAIHVLVQGIKRSVRFHEGLNTGYGEIIPLKVRSVVRPCPRKCATSVLCMCHLFGRTCLPVRCTRL